MKDLIIELGKAGAFALAALVVAIGCGVVPFALYEGQARAAYVTKATGVEIPWYRTPWIDMESVIHKAQMEQRRDP